MSFIIGTLLLVTAIFLILLVLIQRGRGGGLAGAFGGAGGQSAFGTKAGDLFTRITIIVAGVWIVLNIVAIWVLGNKEDKLAGTSDKPAVESQDTGAGGATGPKKPNTGSTTGSKDKGTATDKESTKTTPTDKGTSAGDKDKGLEPPAFAPPPSGPPTPAPSTPSTPPSSAPPAEGPAPSDTPAPTK